MQITLNQDEIHQAVEAYVRSQINIADNQTVAISFTAGRGDNGLSATLSIETAMVPAPVPPKGPVMRKATVTNPTKPVAVQPEPETDPEPPVETNDAEAAEDQGSAEDVPVTDDAADAIPDAPEEADATPAEDPKPKTNLFKKAAEAPANDADAGEEAEAPKRKSIFSKAS